MTRAAIYARYSSHAQNDESIEQQVYECERYAADHKLAVVATYADRAVTGRSDRRPEFQKMIRAAESGDFDMVIAYKSNRIARNMLQALQYEARLDQAGVRVVYCKEEFGDTATGRFMLRSMMNLNQFYSENLSEDVTRGMLENARQCKVNGQVPYGYRALDDKYAPDERTAPVVREIFSRTAAGAKQSEIAADLNARHIPSPRGGIWTKMTLQHLLTNERYVGTYIFGDVRVEGGIPALIDRETFDAAHRPVASTRRRRTPGVVYALTGKLYCGRCDVRMAGESARGKCGTLYHYYRCPGCRQRVRKDQIEAEVVRALAGAVMSDELIDQLVRLTTGFIDELKSRSRVGEITARLSETRKAKANIMRAIEAASTHIQALADRLAELEAAEADLQRDLEREMRAVPDVSEDSVRFYFEQFRGGDVDDPAYRRLLIDTFLLRAYVFPDRLRITFTFDGSALDVCLPALASADIRAEPGAGVRLTAEWGHHLTLTRTQTTIAMIGSVFVIDIYRA